MDGSEEKMTACGRDLFRLRTEQGLSLGEVARRARCSTPYLSNVSYGRRHLTPRVAGLLDKVLGTAAHSRPTPPRLPTVTTGVLARQVRGSCRARTSCP
jgi:hypothetical protein